MAIRTKEFYKFQNRVLEKLSKSGLSQNDNKYCWLLFRETFGYGNLKAKISRDRISDLTGISGTHVSDVERRLKERNIIVISSKNKGFNLDITKWQKVQLSGHFKKVQLSGLKGPGKAEKKGPAIRTLLTKKKENSKKGGVGLKKLEIKEVDELEGKEWLKQVMWQRGNFTEKFIDEIFEIYSFMKCYNAYLAYLDTNNVRFKESWLMAKLQRGQEPEE
ncbi:hypothetical protein ES705_22633 [subsurface metagenome]